MALAALIAKGEPVWLRRTGSFVWPNEVRLLPGEPRLTPDRSPFVFFYERFAG